MCLIKLVVGLVYRSAHRRRRIIEGRTCAKSAVCAFACLRTRSRACVRVCVVCVCRSVSISAPSNSVFLAQRRGDRVKGRASCKDERRLARITPHGKLAPRVTGKSGALRRRFFMRIVFLGFTDVVLLLSMVLLPTNILFWA